MELGTEQDPRADLPANPASSSSTSSTASSSTTTTTTTAPAAEKKATTTAYKPRAATEPPPIPSKEHYRTIADHVIALAGGAISKADLRKERQRIHTARWRAKLRGQGIRTDANPNGNQIGRPPRVQFTPELGEQICLMLADGFTLQEICEAPEMPEGLSPGIIATWAVDKERHLRFTEDYVRARAASTHVRADEAIVAADEAFDKDSALVARAILDSRKWTAASWNREQFGEKLELKGKVEVEHSLSHAPAWLRGELGAAVSQVQKKAQTQPVVIDNDAAVPSIAKPLK